MGYYVYKGTRPGPADKKQLNSIPILRTTYTDIAVNAGTAYYYCIKAFYWDGNESQASAEVYDTVPRR